MNWQTALHQVSPKLDLTVWSAPLQAGFDKFGFNTPRRIAAAIGQFLQEAGETFESTVENLDYSTAARLCLIFPSHFPTITSAQPYINSPEALADVVYGGKGGNTQPGDGWLWRGRGLIDVTFRDGYIKLSADIGMPLAELPAYCETPAGAAVSGCWYLWRNGCLPMADGWEISQITKAVNPAMEGAALRLGYANHMLALLE